MIKQIVEVVTDYEKYNRLCDHLKNYNDGSKVLIFVETKKGCDQLTRSLQVKEIRKYEYLRKYVNISNLDKSTYPYTAFSTFFCIFFFTAV